MKTKLRIFFIFLGFAFQLQIAEASSLYDLEKLRFENETKKFNLLNEIEDSKKKILLNQAAMQERKKDLVYFLKADQKLHQFQFGGLMAIESRPQMDRNLKIFEKIKEKNLNSLRELKYYSEDLDREKKRLIQRNEALVVVSQYLVDQEKKIATEEQNSVQKFISEKQDSLLIYKGTLSSPLLRPAMSIKSDIKNEYRTAQKGITYQTKPSEIVQAIGPGKIIFRDHIKYWGESVILKHAGDYYSVYTNLKNCLVEKNQDVLQSEKIGETASEEFYFELRNQNIAINPKKWIRN